MNGLEVLPTSSRIILYLILLLIAFFTAAVTWAQLGCIRGRFFQNPDGTVDDWREQKIFYGMAWADLIVACPLSVVGLVLTFTQPRLGLLIIAGVSVWFVWANVMTTVTSLRFEKPRITLQWLFVFPLGILVGLGYWIWILVHFHLVYG
jgi:hypothetical protein